MENETQKQRKNMFVPICITQAICISVILLAVLTIKIFYKDAYKKVELWHNKNFLQETTITAVFEEEKT